MQKCSASLLNSEERQFVIEALKQLDALKRKLLELLDKK